MSRSNKPRYGMSCALWKDSVWASRSQKRAWRKTKQIRSQQERTRSKRSLQSEPLT